MRTVKEVIEASIQGRILIRSVSEIVDAIESLTPDLVRTNAYMTTISGKRLFFDDPDPDCISIDDIAYALAGLYRWGGHTNPRWSVAQHSLVGAALIEPRYALEFLFHDAAEAYLGDLIRPVKRMPEVYPYYRAMEERLERVIAAKFKLTYPFPEEVEWTDTLLGFNEARCIVRSDYAGYLYEGVGKVVDPDLDRYFIHKDPTAVAANFRGRAIALLRERSSDA